MAYPFLPDIPKDTDEALDFNVEPYIRQLIALIEFEKAYGHSPYLRIPYHLRCKIYDMVTPLYSELVSPRLSSSVSLSETLSASTFQSPPIKSLKAMILRHESHFSKVEHPLALMASSFENTGDVYSPLHTCTLGKHTRITREGVCDSESCCNGKPKTVLATLRRVYLLQLLKFPDVCVREIMLAYEKHKITIHNTIFFLTLWNTVVMKIAFRALFF